MSSKSKSARTKMDISKLPEPDTDNCGGISQLSPEILAHIFSSLDFPSKIEASQVCTAWRDIISIPTLWKSSCVWLNSWPGEALLSFVSYSKISHLDLSHLDFEQNGADLLIHHLKYLEGLTLWSCSKDTNLHIIRALDDQPLPLLKELCLQGDGFDPEQCLSILARNCPNLVSLKWLICDRPSPLCFSNVVTLLPKLEILYYCGDKLSYFDYLTFNYLPINWDFLAGQCSLKSLTLHSFELNEVLLNRIFNITSLKELKLFDCLILGTEFQLFAVGIPQITAMHIDGLYSQDLPLLLVSKLKLLRKLSLKRLDISWKDIEMLANDSSQISNLQIRMSKCLNNKSMEQVARLSCLTELSLGPSVWYTKKHITDEGLSALAKSKAPIKFLSLNGLSFITDAGLGYLSQMPHLRSLHITKCNLITLVGLVDLTENKLTNLSSLDVSDCCLINAESMTQLKKYPKLSGCLILQPPLLDGAPCNSRAFKSRMDLVSPWASPSEARLWGRDDGEIISNSFCSFRPDNHVQGLDSTNQHCYNFSKLQS